MPQYCDLLGNRSAARCAVYLHPRSVLAARRKQDLRAETMRSLGVEVDCAVDIGEARSWWRADLYDLVLIDTSRGLDDSESFLP